MKFQIKSIELSNTKIILSDEIDNNENIYTLITGKNGLGKTRILSTIILNYLKNSYKKSEYYDDPNYDAFLSLKNLEIEAENPPQKIIAHTNSYFNRFPSEREANSKKYEKPLTSGGYYSNENIFYKILFSKNTNFKAVNETLSYLGYNSVIDFTFELRSGSTPKGYLENMISIYKIPLVDLGFDINIAPQKLPRIKKKFLNILYYIFERRTRKLTENEVIELHNIIIKKQIVDKNIYISINVDDKKINYRSLIKTEFNFLNKFGLIRLLSIYLYNMNTQNDLFNSDKKVNFENLSSGQKSIISTLIGISSSIEDNSLICIDEPEISLHPEWQEEIIFKLQQVFSDIKGCHFIIATHSPQVVSGLNTQNGFIVNLETLETSSSFKNTHKSADYQLATLFDAPGYQNEYLIRICLVVLTKISKEDKLTAEDKESIEMLNRVKSSIPPHDSVFFLIEQILNLVA